MLDIETLSTGANAVILSIAAVPFNLGSTELGPAFHQNINVQSSLDAGAKIDGDTLVWWITKNHQTFKNNLKDPKHITTVLMEFWAFIKNECDLECKVYGKGPSFDNKLVSDAYRLCVMNLPWKYYNERCVRTYLDGWEHLVSENVPFEGEEHDPLADVLHQIQSMQYVYDHNHMIP